LLGHVRSFAGQSFVGEVVSILVAWSFAAKAFVGKVCEHTGDMKTQALSSHKTAVIDVHGD
jgi:hypothetical protein